MLWQARTVPTESLPTKAFHTLVIGGTGLLGYYGVRELCRRGHPVSILALDMPAEGFLPEGVNVVLSDLDACSDDEVRALLAGCEALVFAIGKDDRVVPPRPAYEFFYRANVEPAVRVIRLAREAGVSRAVLCSSMFAHFDRIWPDLELARHHPYVRVRREQEAAVLAAAGDDVAVTILEIAYVFGSVPGRQPLWDPMLRFARSRLPLLGAHGGTNAVAVSHVGEAIAGGIENGYHGPALVGDENMSWNDLLERLARVLGRTRRAHTLPDPLVRSALRPVHWWYELRGFEHGLLPPEFARAMNRGFYFDPAPYRRALGYGSGGLDAAIAETVQAAEPQPSAMTG